MHHKGGARCCDAPGGGDEEQERTYQHGFVGTHHDCLIMKVIED
jgi:hypothetical protein